MPSICAVILEAIAIPAASSFDELILWPDDNLSIDVASDNEDLSKLFLAIIAVTFVDINCGIIIPPNYLIAFVIYLSDTHYEKKTLIFTYYLHVCYNMYYCIINQRGGKMEEERKKKISAVMLKIEKAYGKGSAMLMGDNANLEVDKVSTGSLSVNSVTGIQGFPKGRVVEIFGPESSGKTTLTLHAIAECQKDGGLCAFVDAEHALDPIYAQKLGVDIDSLIISQPDTGEEALGIVEILASEGIVDMIVVDSVAALTPKAEIEGDMGASHMGLQARLMSQALRKLTAVIKKNNVLLIFINQLRMKIGVMFGNPETTTGGNALKFYASMRVDIRRIGAIKDKDAIIGNRTRIKIVKNKMAPPFKQCEVDILFGEGISKTNEAIDLGVDLGIIEKAGAWYSFDGDRLGQGKEKSRTHLVENPEILERITDLIKEKF
jgi:recombination protein RecA